jgi:hypothetical protein
VIVPPVIAGGVVVPVLNSNVTGTADVPVTGAIGAHALAGGGALASSAPPGAGELPLDEPPGLVGDGELPPLGEGVAPLPLAGLSEVPPDGPAGLAVDPDGAPPEEDPPLPPLLGGAELLPQAADATSTKRGKSTAERDLFERGASMTGGLLCGVGFGKRRDAHWSVQVAPNDGVTQLKRGAPGPS